MLWLLVLARCALPVSSSLAGAWRAPRPPPGATRAPLLAAGGARPHATGLYGLANTGASLSIVAVVGALYPVATVLLARGVLRRAPRARAGGRAWRPRSAGVALIAVSGGMTRPRRVTLRAWAAVLAPLQLAPATAAGVLYALRVHHLAGTPRAVPRWRQACFYGGLALIVVDARSPLGHIADELFWAHMAEHLLLADIGALLLVLGLTGPLLAPVLRIRLFDRLRVLAHPLVAAAAVGGQPLRLAPPGAPRGGRAPRGRPRPAAPAASSASGANMWMALFGPLPKPAWFGNAARLGYIVAVRLAGAVLANVLLFGGNAFYDVYAAGEALTASPPPPTRTPPAR